MKDTVSSRLETQCLFMQNNKNYQKILQNILDLLEKENKKPTLLLHVCCGPCSTIPLKQLADKFDITLLFNNSNIYPKQEHDRRYNELVNYINKHYPKIKIISTDYDNEKYNLSLLEHADDPEGHERCRICFRKRFEEGMQIAKKMNIEYFGSVMTISRYKNAQDINKIGEELALKYAPVKWLYADFKKNNGYEDSLLVIKAENMYFQEYCGCIYSYQKYLAKLDLKK